MKLPSGKSLYRTPAQTSSRRGTGSGVRGSALTKDERYNQTEKGRARNARYRKTEKRRLVVKRYASTEKAKLVSKRYKSSDAGKIMRVLWERRPEIRRKKLILQQIRRQNGR